MLEVWASMAQFDYAKRLSSMIVFYTRCWLVFVDLLCFLHNQMLAFSNSLFPLCNHRISLSSYSLLCTFVVMLGFSPMFMTTIYGYNALTWASPMAEFNYDY